MKNAILRAVQPVLGQMCTYTCCDYVQLDNLSNINAYRNSHETTLDSNVNAHREKDTRGLKSFILSAQHKSLNGYYSVANSVLNRTIKIQKATTSDIYDLIFQVFISRKLQLSSVVRISLLCPVPNQLQSRGVSPYIVTHLHALLRLQSIDG